MGAPQGFGAGEAAFAGAGQAGFAPTTRKKRRWLVPLIVFVVTVLAAGSAAVGYVMTRSEPVKWAVGDCVSLAEVNAPAEPDCADFTKAMYRIAYREDVVYPLETACTKYPDVTKAIAEPVAAGAQPGAVLCLAPTRFNKTDPGAMAVGDCVDIKEAGASITRAECIVNGTAVRVIGTEIRAKVPVTEQACSTHPKARQAFAQASLGGRAIVLCTVPVDPSAFANAEVGSCVTENSQRLVDCATPGVKHRVLTVRTLHLRPEKPQCLDTPSASAFSMNSNDKTDFVLAVCLGPAAQDHPLYAEIGDCLAEPVDRRDPSRRVDCADPAASSEVIARLLQENANCPTEWTSKISWNAGITSGLTVCMRRR
ncbi:hypothetical protein [Nocardia sp. NPDC048505]|uniref:LppU/SCO3897 family protein n=1 Tax=unclassified Nocardia TaxID=2637762 RepID=UPI003402AB2C